jgi:ferredoxin-NADP reductase
VRAPARAALDAAQRARSETGLENRGFLSPEWGLLPVSEPRAELGIGHRAWDEIAANLPELWRSGGAREALASMPILGAGHEVLSDGELLRAASLLGHFAHTYVRVQPDVPAALPASIVRPWTEICRRLGRDQTVLTYDDLITNNWRLRDSTNLSRRLDNLDVLTQTVANREERIFYMVQVEAHARMAPAIEVMARAQEAALGGDEREVGTQLGRLIDLIDGGLQAFLKIDPNPHSPTHVDPVVWAKTVAPFAVTIEPGKHAISGAAAPIFQVLDVFLGRSRYDSRVGRESKLLRPGFSPNLQAFIAGLEAAPMVGLVAKCSPELRGLWYALIDAYAGDRGFLGVHRRKAYAYLSIAFKVGRSVTTGGFSGMFDDQTWDVADRELEASRSERLDQIQGWCPVAHAEGPGELNTAGLAHLRLDVGAGALRHRPGGRLAVLPRNSRDLVERTMKALHATGSEKVALDQRWRAETGVESLPISELLERGRIRPVARETAKALQTVAQSDRLARIIEARAESGWEFWDLLEHVAEGGFDPRVLLRTAPWEPHSLARLVPPEAHRMYSISSVLDAEPAAQRVELLASELRYVQPVGALAPAAERIGTASSYLKRAASTGERVPVPFRHASATRFRLPEAPERPIVMFAGGVGMSAFRAFIAERARTPAAGPAWLLLSTRSAPQRDLFADEAANVRFDAVVTQTAPSDERRRRIGDLISEHADELRGLIYDKEAVFYVSGPTEFAAAVVVALERLSSTDTVRTIIASGRLQQDVFTSSEQAPPAAVLLNASDVATRNSVELGYWTIIDGGVYDLSEFAHRHAGGMQIIHDVAGRDGTASYRQIEHHLNPEVEAMLPAYRIGTIRRLEFGAAGTIAIDHRGLTHVMLADVFAAWVRYLHRIVEVENAVRGDFGALDTIVVGHDSPGTMSFLAARVMMDAHRRLIDVYLPALLDRDPALLWRLSTSLVRRSADVRDLGRALTACGPKGARAAERAATFVDRMRVAAGKPGQSVVLEECRALRGPLEAAGLGFLAALKDAIRSGVALFEQFERATPRQAGTGLLAPLEAIPPLVAALHDASNSAFDGLARV